MLIFKNTLIQLKAYGQEISNFLELLSLLFDGA